MARNTQGKSQSRQRQGKEGVSQRTLVLGLVAIVLIFVILTLFTGLGKNVFKIGITPTPSRTVVPISQLPTPTPLNGDTVMFTGIKFTPTVMNVTVGAIVDFANFGDSNIDIRFKDPNSKLSPGIVRPDETSNFVKFDNAGVYDYFDANDPQNKYHQGSISVK